MHNKQEDVIDLYSHVKLKLKFLKIYNLNEVVFHIASYGVVSDVIKILLPWLNNFRNGFKLPSVGS